MGFSVDHRTESFFPGGDLKRSMEVPKLNGKRSFPTPWRPGDVAGYMPKGVEGSVAGALRVTPQGDTY